MLSAFTIVPQLGHRFLAPGGIGAMGTEGVLAGAGADEGGLATRGGYCTAAIGLGCCAGGG